MESDKKQVPEFASQLSDQKMKNLIQKLERNTNLIFLPEDSNDPNLCLADSKEVRDEFRTSYGWSDLKAFLNANGFFTKNTDLQDIPIPGDSSDFWAKVKKGNPQ